MSVENLRKLAEQVNLDGFWYKEMVQKCKDAAARGEMWVNYECNEEIPGYMKNKLNEEYNVGTTLMNSPNIYSVPIVYKYRFYFLEADTDSD